MGETRAPWIGGAASHEDVEIRSRASTSYREAGRDGVQLL